ncbi:hypothetical protein GCM10008088_21230 [Mesonia mobilis]|uniref:FAS1 domain-containing protein n=2 Tax=Mesonia mobilis TaxID=369791 RepID=A0ABQ3BW04_9FLAO|nr:hypothetical protein GCM10008088_21230 [Mesonia mobilis]
MMNKFILKVTKLLFLLSITLTVFSCVDDDDNGNVIEGNNSIINYMEKTPRFSLFYDLVVQAELDAALDGNSGTYTLLAPNNTAVEVYLSENSLSGINDISQELAFDLVYYHLLETINTEQSFTTGYLKTLAETPLTDSTATNLSLLVNTASEVEFNGDVHFVNADIEVDNGIMHEIDKMMALPSVETFMIADSNLTPFYTEAISTSSLFQSQITSAEKFTYLIPSADTFTTFWENTDYTSEEKEQLINYHVQDSLKLNSDLEAGYQTTNATTNINGEDKFLSIYLNKDVGLLYNGISSITVQDIVGTNGVIHTLDEVITLPTLADFITADLKLTTLVEAISRDDISAENYLEKLNNTNTANAPYTIFAPTDTAFEDVLLELYPNDLSTLEDIETQDLIDILNLHFAENLNLELDNYNASSVNTLGGTIEIDVTVPSLADINNREALILSSEEIQAVNGVFYKIDTVLLPQQ